VHEAAADSSVHIPVAGLLIDIDVSYCDDEARRREQASSPQFIRCWRYGIGFETGTTTTTTTTTEKVGLE